MNQTKSITKIRALGIIFAMCAGIAMAADYQPYGALPEPPPVVIQPYPSAQAPAVLVTPVEPRCRTVRTIEHDGILDKDDWTQTETCDE